ncbi:MAG: hypothetical protein MJ252_25190 [archaeon]|nr:hypothetical protein [archaeon]
MNKLSIFILFVIPAIFAWKPRFTGHRGGYTGVENTVESYTNGVELYHYSGLECDVRVTKDGQYVSCHDDSITGDKGKMVVKDHTLEELKSNLITQTRGNKTYTGHICTMDEYLSICKVKNVVPIIELKSAVGINSTDMTNFAGLDEKVKFYGLQDKAIYISFNAGSLEYILQHYPGYRVNYLMNEMDDEKFAWLQKWKVSPSIKVGGFGLTEMKKLKNAGLDAACWCVNSKENYLKYARDIGVFMMTCDYLFPDEMPEVDYPWFGNMLITNKVLKKAQRLQLLESKAEEEEDNNSIEKKELEDDEELIRHMH